MLSTCDMNGVSVTCFTPDEFALGEHLMSVGLITVMLKFDYSAKGMPARVLLCDYCICQLEYPERTL